MTNKQQVKKRKKYNGVFVEYDRNGSVIQETEVANKKEMSNFLIQNLKRRHHESVDWSDGPKNSSDLKWFKKNTIACKKGDAPYGHPLPFDCILFSNPEFITNPYTKVRLEVQPDAVAVYDSVKGAEYLLETEKNLKAEAAYAFVNGLNWFGKYYPKEYKALLD